MSSRGPFQSIFVYSTPGWLYFIGAHCNEELWSLMKVARQSDHDQVQMEEEDFIYTRETLGELLETLKAAFSPTGSFKLIAKAFGIIGFISFTSHQYLLLATGAKSVGQIGTSPIYSLSSVEWISLSPTSSTTPSSSSSSSSSSLSASSSKATTKTTTESSKPQNSTTTSTTSNSTSTNNTRSTRPSSSEVKYKTLFGSLDLTRGDFYFSPTYDLSRSLQYNSSWHGEEPGHQPNLSFVWNAALAKALVDSTGVASILHSPWAVSLIHGSFAQSRLSVLGRPLAVTLIARRSTRFAGTRYLKRGVAPDGSAANEVETEQMVFDGDSGSNSLSSKWTSVLLLRGSIPVYWRNAPNPLMTPKPPILLYRADPYAGATRAHFADLLRRYSSPVIALDLVRQKEKGAPRETLVAAAYTEALKAINADAPPPMRIRRIAWDFAKAWKKSTAAVPAALAGLSERILAETGLFTAQGAIAFSHPLSSSFADGVVPETVTLQEGICRFNCIDSLDRTNTAQYCFGVTALGYQLTALGLIPAPEFVRHGSPVAEALLTLYVDAGHAIAQQYAGSDSVHTISARRSSSKGGGKGSKGKDLLSSIQRYYSNHFTDTDKQHAISLFTRTYLPHDKEKTPLWKQLGSDTPLFLHTEEELEARPPLDPSLAALWKALRGGKPWWEVGMEAHRQELGVPPGRSRRGDGVDGTMSGDEEHDGRGARASRSLDGYNPKTLTSFDDLLAAGSHFSMVAVEVGRPATLMHVAQNDGQAVMQGGTGGGETKDDDDEDDDDEERGVGSRLSQLFTLPLPPEESDPLKEAEEHDRSSEKVGLGGEGDEAPTLVVDATAVHRDRSWLEARSLRAQRAALRTPSNNALGGSKSLKSTEDMPLLYERLEPLCIDLDRVDADDLALYEMETPELEVSLEDAELYDRVAGLGEAISGLGMGQVALAGVENKALDEQSIEKAGQAWKAVFGNNSFWN